ncbi:2,4'-dihydroxyacetophenone dioxygenase family protein [uncultured Nevskia sp.]|uniref:2,4'-dihydroxyacetophenone dioxygenase family protein n=1 Tax=uncultured Nevskia sp. TaxID=228950 RepID=UPI0025DD99FE|nr:2,4'-dihydroxyacetophenone dioxygenase family protein [uncultured Nevskia sp.]
MADSTSLPTQKLRIPQADHRAYADIPFVEFMKGVDMQLLQIDIEAGLWVVRIRFAPGVTIPTHKHTGEVFALTSSGSWKYLEYPDINVAGSYLFEPAGSVHTLHVPASNHEVTEAWFAIRGANLNLDEQGTVTSVWDAGYIRDEYLRLCREAGHPVPPVLGLDHG